MEDTASTRTNVPTTLAPLKRTAWMPVVTDGDGDLRASKFAGTPWLSQAEEWPRCPNCAQPIQLFLQLDLEQLPEAVRDEYGTGLLQLFYCKSVEPPCDAECEAFFPFARSVLVRLIVPAGEPQRRPDVTVAEPFPPKLIVAWRAVDDYPNCEESRELGVALAEAEWAALEERGLPRPGDKLAGWPHWVQGVEYPDCPVCSARMRLVFQLDSNDNLPFLFGDVGCAHITQCPQHKEQLAFGWACG
jgi:uncharacterized protein YwqG